MQISESSRMIYVHLVQYKKKVTAVAYMYKMKSSDESPEKMTSKKLMFDENCMCINRVELEFKICLCYFTIR